MLLLTLDIKNKKKNKKKSRKKEPPCILFTISMYRQGVLSNLQVAGIAYNSLCLSYDDMLARRSDRPIEDGMTLSESAAKAYPMTTKREEPTACHHPAVRWNIKMKVGIVRVYALLQTNA